MQKLITCDRFVGAHMPWFVMGFVILGLTFPDVFSPLNDILVYPFAFMTFANTLGSGFRDLGRVFLRPLPVLLTLVLLHVVIPLLALAFGNLFFPHAPLFTTGLVLEYAIPTGVSSLMWVAVAGGNTMLCLSIVLLDTLISPVVIPLSLRLLVGSVVEVDTVSMMQNMAVMVALPAFLAMVLFQVGGVKVTSALKPRLSLFSKLALFAMIAANSTGCLPFLRQLNLTLVMVIIAVLVLCAVGFLLGYWIPRILKMSYPDCAALTMNVGLRNIAAGAVLANEFFPPDVLFPVAFTPLFLQFSTSIVAKVMTNVPYARAHAAQQPHQS